MGRQDFFSLFGNSDGARSRVLAKSFAIVTKPFLGAGVRIFQLMEAIVAEHDSRLVSVELLQHV